MSATTATVYGPRKRSKLDLMGIRFDRDEGDESTTTGEGAGAGSEEKPEVIATASNPKPKPGTQTVGESVEQDPVEGSTDGGKTFSPEYVEKLRKENAAARVANKDEIARQIAEATATAEAKAKKEAYEALGKSLGLVAEDETDPEKILEQARAEREQAKQELESERAERAAEKAAAAKTRAIAAATTANEGDLTLVNAVLTAENSLKDIDVTADDYDAQVAVIVKDAIEKNPKLRAVQVAQRSGGNNTHSGEPIAAASSVDSYRKAYRESRGIKI